MFGWFDRDRLQSAGPNSYIAVTAAIPLPATIIVAVYGATEGKAPSASVKTLAMKVSAARALARPPRPARRRPRRSKDESVMAGVSLWALWIFVKLYHKSRAR